VLVVAVAPFQASHEGQDTLEGMIPNYNLQCVFQQICWRVEGKRVKRFVGLVFEGVAPEFEEKDVAPSLVLRHRKRGKVRKEAARVSFKEDKDVLKMIAQGRQGFPPHVHLLGRLSERVSLQTNVRRVSWRIGRRRHSCPFWFAGKH
jgi:hypothetical protein